MQIHAAAAAEKHEMEMNSAHFSEENLPIHRRRAGGSERAQGRTFLPADRVNYERFKSRFVPSFLLRPCLLSSLRDRRIRLGRQDGARPCEVANSALANAVPGGREGGREALQMPARFWQTMFWCLCKSHLLGQKISPKGLEHQLYRTFRIFKTQLSEC